jgi:hypothetical protein
VRVHVDLLFTTSVPSVDGERQGGGRLVSIGEEFADHIDACTSINALLGYACCRLAPGTLVSLSMALLRCNDDKKGGDYRRGEYWPNANVNSRERTAVMLRRAPLPRNEWDLRIRALGNFALAQANRSDPFGLGRSSLRMLARARARLANGQCNHCHQMPMISPTFHPLSSRFQT